MTERAEQIATAATQWMADRIGWTEEGFSNVVNWVWPQVKPEWNGEPWCAAAVTAAYLHAGVDIRPLCAGNNSFFCPNLESMARTYGVWVQSEGVGKIVIYGGSYGVHTGISAPQDGGLWAYEGNTSPSSTGSQNNGGGLYYRRRARSWVRGWIDMPALIDKLDLGPHPTPPPIQPTQEEEDIMLYLLRSPHRFVVVDPIARTVQDLGDRVSQETIDNAALPVRLSGNDRQCDLNIQLLLDAGYARP